MPHFKQMDESQLSKLQTLEKEIGGNKRVIAFDSGPKFAEISSQQLEKIRSIEKELGATLVVYGDK